mgnify:FL=1|jgi:hypothetical protein|tara:strand:- start:215 stop:418 length:204 start_codon:yes stop_codon:yes gene_type:complete
MKEMFLKGLEYALAAHGFLHIIEFGTAMYEEAYITASFAAFGAITMLLGAYFLGHHHHHHIPHIENH